LDKLRWRFDYLYNGDSSQITSTQSYRNAFSIGMAGDKGRIGGAVNVMFTDGMDGHGNAFGVSFLPTYELIPDKLRLVGRFHYSGSDADNTLLVQKRYESEVPEIGDKRGRNYHSGYAGINWVIHKNIRFLNGLEYSTMQGSGRSGGDFDGWTFFSGFRIWF
jgi:phosphate-selective porin OprO/OprP